MAGLQQSTLAVAPRPAQCSWCPSSLAPAPAGPGPLPGKAAVKWTIQGYACRLYQWPGRV